MGTCTSTKKSVRILKESTLYNSPKFSNNSEKPNVLPIPIQNRTISSGIDNYMEKIENSKNHIKNFKEETLVKKINEVDGEQIIIENCSNCTIIVLDYSSQVTIEKCKDCNIFIGPCKSSVLLRNCEGINIIAACQQFKATNNSNVKLSLFVLTKPIIECCYNFQIGCFNFDYTGILDIFNTAELNPWNNKWSDYEIFSGSDTSYFNAWIEVDYFKELKMNVLIDQEVIEKNFVTIPYTHGLSFDYKDSSNYHIIMIFDAFVKTEELLFLCDPTYLLKEDCFLIMTINFLKGSQIAEEIKKFNPETNIILDNKENFIALWVICKNSDNLSFLDQYIKGEFEEEFSFLMYEPIMINIKELIIKIFEKIDFN